MDVDMHKVAAVVPIAVMEALCKVVTLYTVRFLQQHPDDCSDQAGWCILCLADTAPAAWWFNWVRRTHRLAELCYDIWITEQLALADKRLAESADEYMQLMNLCSVIMRQFWRTGELNPVYQNHLPTPMLSLNNILAEHPPAHWSAAPSAAPEDTSPRHLGQPVPATCHSTNIHPVIKTEIPPPADPWYFQCQVEALPIRMRLLEFCRNVFF